MRFQDYLEEFKRMEGELPVRGGGTAKAVRKLMGKKKKKKDLKGLHKNISKVGKKEYKKIMKQRGGDKEEEKWFNKGVEHQEAKKSKIKLFKDAMKKEGLKEAEKTIKD